MRNVMIGAMMMGLLGLGACNHEEKHEDNDTGTCPIDTAVDTGVDTGDTSVTATCTDSTGTYSVGDTWTCPDGCNTCGCIESDVIASTDMACGDTGSSDTGAPPDTGTGDTGGTDTSAPADTGATDTGASSDTGSGGTDTSAG